MKFPLACSLLLLTCLCSVLAAAPAPLYIVTGQSNSLGAVKGTPAPSALLERYQSSAYLWNGNMNRDSGECFEKQPEWRPVAPQLPNYAGHPCMGPEYGFAAMMERRLPALKSKLHITKASLDGGGNSYWLKGGNAYNTLLQVIRDSIKNSDTPLKLAGLLYLQGESDSGKEIAYAAARFPALVKNLKGDLQSSGIHARGLSRCVIGQPANWHGKDKEFNGKTTASELHQLARKNKNIGWVYTRDLTKITQGDGMGVHYDGTSQITIGARFAYAMLLQQGQKLGAIRNDTPNVSLNTPSAWWNGKVPSENDIACWDVASAHGEDQLFGKLTVRGIRIEDPFGGQATLTATPSGMLALGNGGIELQQGSLLLRDIRLLVTADQRWEIAEGQTLELQHVTIDAAGRHITISNPERLKTDGCRIINGNLHSPDGNTIPL